MNYAQRFRYGNLTQMYSKFREMFRKRMKQKEEGTVQRHFGAAAREIEAERARKRAEAEKSETLHFPFSVSWKDPDQEKKKVEQLFAAFRNAKEQAGEDTEPLTMEAFQKFVRQKTSELQKQKNAHEVEYVVSVEDNHARLKARVKS
jgi:membrane-associated HD superfamily phosphohydrolase